MAHIREKKKRIFEVIRKLATSLLLQTWGCRQVGGSEGLARGILEGDGRLGFLTVFFPDVLHRPGEHLAKPDPSGCPLWAQQFGL